jgi:methionyl-tRNA formyltransferase
MTSLAPLPVGPVRRVAFLGTPSLAVPVLEALVNDGLHVAHVVTRVDKRRGRGSDLSPSPVKECAERLGLVVGHSVDELLEIHRREPIDLGVVVAYGALIKAHVLCELPMVNIHVSLLPRWRGAAPIERALLAGDSETGVCIMQVEEGLDTGGVLASARMPISSDTTADDIRAHLVAAGTELLLAQLRSGLSAPVPQVGEPTHAAKIEPAELRIDWSHDAATISRLIRLGGAWTTHRGRRLKIHVAEVRSNPSDSGPVDRGAIRIVDGDVVVGTAAGVLVLRSVQPEGKNRMDAVSWSNGAKLGRDEAFGDG